TRLPCGSWGCPHEGDHYNPRLSEDAVCLGLNLAETLLIDDMVMRLRSRRFRVGLVFAAFAVLVAGLARSWDHLAEKRVAVVASGKLVRGAWQRPWPLRRIIKREKIRTIVTLTAINRDDPKYVGQSRVVSEAGVGWVIV